MLESHSKPENHYRRIFNAKSINLASDYPAWMLMQNVNRVMVYNSGSLLVKTKDPPTTPK